MPANIYRLKDGSIVAGVTTIINQLDKPALINWAWKLGTEGKDWKEERDSAGDIGTLVHELVLGYWRGEVPDITAPDEVSGALMNGCYWKFIDWVKAFTIAPVLVEEPIVSERYQFGGQPDLLASINGRMVLLDVKTSNGIYDSFWLQLAGYDILLRENGYKVDEYQILWLPKDDRFDCPIRTDLRREKKIFKHLLEIYQLRREE